ncbi:hypothetical protein [Clostridium magnum]|uniref:Uncharacterized protein n=1 Tax=Clostridium magnum DSM 2767 TaxID=1121326 RepID=A0A161YTD1_9CLOT|nr:hypothetical protein [Clostridium magnum]KZL94352.1 hypothetical protein CLMAG_14050 [Clostridium magnum DSM 2767]SHJ52396.1 hypothetical protein SAMN02745944_06105 [Clostridium magnum DSM 2767]
MANRKQFSDLDNIKKLGILLKVSDTALQESLVLLSNSLNKTDALVKRINNVSEKVSALRSDIDDALVKIIDIDLYRSLSDNDLNKLMYPDLNDEECIRTLQEMKR